MLDVDPYLIVGPALISFSGGRTSAYMLWKILQAHNGRLPADVYVTFANTGKELEKTLRFVHEIESRWNVRIYWLQRTADGGFEIVGYNSAARKGEPFADLIAKKKYLPNAVTRFCTVELKIRVMRDFARSVGFERWNNIVGLRYDEGMRVMKALARNDEGRERFQAVMPMAKAKATKRGHVLPFWLGENADPINLTHPLPQGFDLGIRDHEGNCDLCFLKSKAKLAAIMRENPGSADWWIEQEETVGASKPSGARFVTEYSYRGLLDHTDRSPMLFDDSDHDAECGLLCQP
jgi:3'-phosphoadenosine 5'-phosphosulfate sulfotransferase (PAPS reductase)/FAD synthetase